MSEDNIKPKHEIINIWQFSYDSTYTLVELMSILLCNAYSKCSLNDGDYNHLIIITFKKNYLKVNVS